ncbi:Uncharacterised protein [Mycobacteroides abscessus subsp. abscessus]|nr:Uncharacterised protein [Mycobacteroides abscessus subsp. abscessus]
MRSLAVSAILSRTVMRSTTITSIPSCAVWALRVPEPADMVQQGGATAV